jgi:hypothetical protein
MITMMLGLLAAFRLPNTNRGNNIEPAATPAALRKSLLFRLIMLIT